MRDQTVPHSSSKSADTLLDRVWSNTETSPNIGMSPNIREIRAFKILAALAALGVTGEDVGAVTQTSLKRCVSNCESGVRPGNLSSVDQWQAQIY
jgi:hypothetical protein